MSLRISESPVRVVFALSTPPLLVAIAWLFWRVDGVGWVTVVSGALAFFLGLVVLFDYPLAIEFDDLGIHRVSLLRRRVIPWADILVIGRHRRTGLSAITRNRKRHVLIDRRLDPAEADLLRTQAQLRDVIVEF